MITVHINTDTPYQKPT